MSTTTANATISALAGTLSCPQIAAQVAALEQEEIRLTAANDIAQIQLAAARNAYDSAKHHADVAERRLLRNRYKQMTLHDDFNSQGC
jgi:capsule polysaccharide export protein KpsE/RkpR